MQIDTSTFTLFTQMLVELLCDVQTYDWGKLGKSSAVARFAAAQSPDFHIQESTPYAELWMGTHPKAPSQIKGGKENLRELVAGNDKLLGEKVAAKFGDQEIPFLFKVLSIRKALSIQAHPDKLLARQLHARDPKNYPDDNHKPEMAIALTDFEGFCGFRPAAEIASFLKIVPEFAELAGQAGTNFCAAVDKDPKGEHRKELQALFGAVMGAPQTTIDPLAEALCERAAREKEQFCGCHGGLPLADLIQRASADFPRDVGVFCGGMMLNYCRLKKGEAMFLKAKDPHAYISGDIIECMAASDNVVRAGFTPKFKDVQTLVDMLTFDTAPVSEQKMTPAPFARAHGGEALYFDPPIEEFGVLQLTTGTKSTVDALEGPSIFIVTEGQGTVKAGDASIKYTAGSVFFVSAGTALELEASEHTVSYHAICEV